MVKPVSERKSDTVKALNLRNARQTGGLFFYVMQYSGSDTYAFQDYLSNYFLCLSHQKLCR